MVTFIVILISLIIGGVAGFKIGGYHSMKLVHTVTEENTRLREFAKAWASAASSTTQISNDAANQTTHNLNSTIHTVIQLLGTVQQQQANTLSSHENEKVTQLINQAKSLTSP